MPIVTKYALLPAPRDNFTGQLGRKYNFYNGRLRLRGDLPYVDKVMDMLVRDYECRIVEAAPDGKRDLPEAPESEDQEQALRGGVQSRGQGPSDEASDDGAGSDDAGQGDAGILPDGDGHPDPRLDRVKEAVARLDPSKDAHWIGNGLPKVAAVAKLARMDDVTRRDIDKAAPGFTREG